MTGATGFIGRALCARLTAAGHAVRAVVRNGERLSDVECFDITGLADVRGLEQAMVGVEAVVHLAARVHAMHDHAFDALAAYREINVEGTRTVIDTAVAAGIEHFVLGSSVKAVGERSERPWREADCAANPLDAYGASKLEAELLVRQRARKHGLKGAIFRFPVVYGPRMKGNVLRLMRWIDRGLPVVASETNRRSLLFVENATTAIVSALQHDVPIDDAYFLSDGRDLSTFELADMLGRAIGRRACIICLSPRAARRIDDLGARVPFGAGTKIRSAVQRLTSSLQVDSSSARARFDLQDLLSVEAGIDITAAWYRAEARQ